MIHTVTLNPSLDYFVRLPSLTPGALHRTADTRLTAGGKGINVAAVLQRLGEPVLAHGFAAGGTGALLERLLEKAGLPHAMVQTADGMTRINVKLLAGEETEINGTGPTVGKADFAALTAQVTDALRAGDCVVLSGAAAPGVTDADCAALLEQAAARGALTVADTHGKLLLALAHTHPFLVKPNEAELTALFDCQVDSRAVVLDCARRLQAEGARHVLVSRGAAGALLMCEDGAVYEQPAYDGAARGTVGAGDSMVAGFLAGWLRTRDPRQALCWGVAAGCATAFAGQLCTREQVEALLQL